MVTPEYFMSPSTAWGTWISTALVQDGTYFLCWSAMRPINRPVQNVEDMHPGFSAAYKTLTGLGADEYFVTSVLKYCIEQSVTEALDAFIIRSNIVLMLPSALAIGLSGAEFVAALDSKTQAVGNVIIPEDVFNNS